MNRFSTDFLAASGSLLIGMGSVFNLQGQYFTYNMAPSPQEADARALWHDFAMVGQDIGDGLASVSEEEIAA